MSPRIAIFSDAWIPQISGVVTTLKSLKQHLEWKGCAVKIIHPYDFINVRCPTYPSVPLAPFACLFLNKIEEMMQEFRPNAIHIMVEEPIGWAGRRYCSKYKTPFTTSYTTKFPEYIEKRFQLPSKTIYKMLRWFHSIADSVMVTTNAVKRELEEHGFKNIVKWSRGVDTKLFRPIKSHSSLPKPVCVYMGRLARDKGIDDFLSLTLPGSKLVIGNCQENLVGLPRGASLVMVRTKKL